MALRDCGITSMALAGVAMEIGIKPAARQAAADLGIVPVIVEDGRGNGHAEVARRPVESLKFAGDAVFTDAEIFCGVDQLQAAEIASGFSLAPAIRTPRGVAPLPAISQSLGTCSRSQIFSIR